MNDFWLKVAGVPADRIPDDAETELMFSSRLPESWAVFVLIGGVVLGLYLIMWLYRREISTCPKPVRITLGVLRSLVLLMLVLVALGPAIAYTQMRRVDPFIVLALDASRSMGEPDRYLDEASVAPIAAATGDSPKAIRDKKPTRAAILDQVLAADNGQLVRQFAEKGKLRVVLFSDQAVVKETKPRYSPNEKPVEESVVRQPGELAMPELAFWTIGSAVLVVVCAALALARQKVIWALVGAVPLTVGFFAITMLTEQNPGVPVAALFGVGEVEESKADRLAREEKNKKEEDLRKPFNASLSPLADAAKGPATNYGRAIRKALESAANNVPLTIVLVGDGQNTAGGEDWKKAAEEARDRNIGINTVGIGDTSRQRRLDLPSVYAVEQTWRGDPFEIQAVIKAKAYDGPPLEIALYEQEVGVPGEGTLIERRTVKLTGEDAQQIETFKHTPKREGKYNYVVKIEKGPDSAIVEGTRQDYATVTVLSEKARVLLVAGAPSWEYRTVTVLLTREKTVNLSCWLQSMDLDMPQEGTTKIKKLPYTKEELAPYDVVLLFDPDPNEFSDAWVSALREFVSEGGGLLYMAGPKYGARYLTDVRSQGIKDLVPVRFANTSAIETDSLAKFTKPWPLKIVPANLDHAVMRFETDSKLNLARWERMPGIFWSFPALAPKPGARTLLEHSDPTPPVRSAEGWRPLLVSGQYGAGRTLYMGFNGTWRWRSVGHDSEYFDKFWVQIVRFLVEGRLMGAQKRGVLELAKDRYHVGDEVAITARLKNAQGEPLVEPTVAASLEMDGGKSPPRVFQLNPVPGKKGEYEGTVQALAEGTHAISVSLPGVNATEMVRINTKAFKVELSTVELLDRSLNKDLLKDIVSRASEQHRGQYYEIDQLDQLAKAIPDQTVLKPVPGKPIELWDTSRLAFLLVLLLTIEWGARKRFKLL